MTGRHERSVRRAFARTPGAYQVTRPGVGGLQWVVSLTDYARARGLHPDDVLALLHPLRSAA